MIELYYIYCNIDWQKACEEAEKIAKESEVAEAI